MSVVKCRWPNVGIFSIGHQRWITLTSLCFRLLGDSFGIAYLVQLAVARMLIWTMRMEESSEQNAIPNLTRYIVHALRMKNGNDRKHMVSTEFSEICKTAARLISVNWTRFDFC